MKKLYLLLFLLSICISANSQVGIGTTNPKSKLEVVDSGTAEFRISSTSGFGAARLSFISDKDTGVEWRPAFLESSDSGGFTGRLNFYTNGTGYGNFFTSKLAMSVFDGNVGIGSISPSNKLEVVGNTKTTNLQITTGATANYVLQSDAAGNATWVNPTSLTISETDPQVSSATINTIPKYNGTTLVDGVIVDNGTNVGVGITPTAGNKLEIAGKTKTDNLQMTNGANANFILQSDAYGNASWSSPALLPNNDNDWYKEGTPIPASFITDDIYHTGNIAIGKTYADSPLDIYNLTNNIGLTLSSTITTSDSTPNIGIHNSLWSNSTDEAVANNSQLYGNGVGEFVINKNEFLDNGNGKHYVNKNIMNGIGIGDQFANYSYINGTGSGSSGDKYGYYDLINPNSGGKHYGVFSEVLKTGSFAGYFLGNVSIGTTAANNYILPTTRGTNNQIIQTDATGNATWVNPTSLTITETDPQVSVFTVNAIPRWIGTTLVDGVMIDNGTNVGIGTTPTAGNKLEVAGKTLTSILEVTNKTTTDRFRMISGGVDKYVLQSDPNGNASWVNPNTLIINETDPQVSSATTNTIPKYNGTTLVDGVMVDDGTNVGIGTTPTAGNKLEVAGKTKTINLQMTTGATANYVLQSDAIGNATWVNPTSLTITETDLQVSVFTVNAIPRWIGTTLVDGVMIDNGTNVAIGTTPTSGNKLEVAGKTKTTNLQMTTGATANYVLQSDAAGNASWVNNNGGFTHYLGELYLGGVIFELYKGSDGLEHGLVVALTESTLQWQTTLSNIAATRQEDGAYNTNLMINSPAAAYIVTLGIGWYIPSVDEFRLLNNNRFYVNRALRSGGYDLLNNFGYWTSTQYDINNAFHFVWSTDYFGPLYKTNSLYVRGIKSF